MTEVTLQLDSTAALLYQRIAKARGISLEQVLSDALFKLAGELSLQAIQRNAAGNDRLCVQGSP